MTLDEAIEHDDWMAYEASRGPLADEYRQRAEWLHELRTLRGLKREVVAYVRRTGCWKCPYDDGCDYTGASDFGEGCRLGDELRRLGVEVRDEP